MRSSPWRAQTTAQGKHGCGRCPPSRCSRAARGIFMCLHFCFCNSCLYTYDVYIQVLSRCSRVRQTLLRQNVVEEACIPLLAASDEQLGEWGEAMQVA